MPSVTFLLAVDIPEISPEALAMESDDITDDLSGLGHNVLSCVPWARPSQPTAQPSGGFTSLMAPPSNAPTA